MKFVANILRDKTIYVNTGKPHKSILFILFIDLKRAEKKLLRKFIFMNESIEMGYEFTSYFFWLKFDACCFKMLFKLVGGWLGVFFVLVSDRNKS